MRTASRRVGLWVLVLGVALAALPLAAQDHNTPGFMTFEGGMTERPDPSKVLAVESALWREMGLERAGFPARLLDVLSEKNLVALAAGADPATVETMSGESVSEVLAIGDLNADLVYQPVNPCRLVNTLVAGGGFAGGESRNYNLIGPANYAGIGGNAAGCNIPAPFISGIVSFNTVRALNLNYISVAPGGPGDFRAWPTNQAVPLASVLNYANVGGGLNIANGLATTTCDAFCLDLIAPFTCGDPCPLGDLSVQADVSGTHLIIDVYGYFIGADVNNVRGGSSENNVVVNIDLTEGTCVTATSCSVTNNSTSSIGVVVLGNVSLNVNHTLGTHDEILATLSTTAATCDAFPIDPGTAWYDVNNNVPSGSTWQGSIAVAKRFSLAGETSATYYLNVNQFDGGPGDSVDMANIICLRDP